MTRCNKVIRRVCSVASVPYGVRRECVVSLYPPGNTIGIREKGRRKEFFLDVGLLYMEAVKRFVAQMKAERKKKRRKQR